MEKTKEYFERQIKGLLLIMKQNQLGDNLVSRDYITEKLNMILVDGIGFHPIITEKLNKLQKEL